MKSLCLFVAALSITIFFYHPALAQSQQDIINQQDWITRNQQNKIDEERRDKEFETIHKERERRKKEQSGLDEEFNSKQTKTKKAPQCFAIDEINLNGATLISKREQKKIIQPFLGQCFDGRKILELVDAVSKFYHNKGYVSTQVLAPKQSIDSRKLELQIIEGKVEEVILNDNHLSDRMQEFTAFGNLEDEALDLADINQGLYQINRLRSNRAVMKIEPGIVEGQSKVYVQNQSTLPVHATVGYDNLGNKFTGVNRTNFSGGLDNLFFLNDSTNLNYSTNFNDKNSEKNINSFSGSFSIPFLYYTATFDYSKSDFLGTNPGINGPLKLSGFSDRKNITLERVLLNAGNLRFASSISLTQKESASYLNSQRIDTSQRKLTIANLSFSLSNYFDNGVNLYLRPSFSRGTKMLNAQQDAPNASAATPSSQFQLMKFYASISKKIILPKIKAPVLLAFEMDSQLSKDTLFGSEQFAVGGYYSVRGFRENYLVGDSGYYFRNKASFNVGSLVLPMLGENPGYFVHLNKFKVEPFYDYGHTYTRFDNSGGRLAGAGVKTIFESKYFNASLTYSAATNRSNLVNKNYKENKLIYFELSASCC